VLDEILITDGALTKERYKTLLVLQGDIVDQPILKRFDAFLRYGGKIVQIGDAPICTLKASSGRVRKIKHVSALHKNKPGSRNSLHNLPGLKGADGQLDGLWIVVAANRSSSSIRRTSR